MAVEALVPGARHAVAPAGIASTAWPRIERTCRNIGWRFDPWQAATGRLILSKTATGSWAADLSIMSIPRQVGKSYLLGCIIFALCLLNPKLRVIWTSHHTATTEEMYEAFKELALHKRVAPHVSRCVALQGSRWRIVFKNGSRIDFGSRERGFGRGKAKVDVIVLDEFQHITMRALANLAPTTNAAANPLILAAGTPPGPLDNAEAFSMRRKAAIENLSSDTLYVEFSADPDADLDDRAQWAKANPSFPRRTKERAFLLNRKILDEENFRREFLGIWDEVSTSDKAVPLDSWATCRMPTSKMETDPIFALDVSPARSHAAIAVAGQAPGAWHVEITSRHGVMDCRSGVSWVLPRVQQLLETFPRLRLVIASNSAAESLVPSLTAMGVEVATVSDLSAACGFFYDRVVEHELRHLGQPDLDGALLNATRKDVGDSAFVWWRRKSTADISALYAATLALWQAEQDRNNSMAAIDNLW